MTIDAQISCYWNLNDYYKFEHVDVLWAPGYFEFICPAKSGPVLKGVAFQKSEETPNLFDLIYGDVKEDIKISTAASADSNDLEKLLLTIAIITIKFISNYPGQQVKINGIDSVRTRLYRRFINKNIEYLASLANIYGQNINEISTEALIKPYHKDYAHVLVEAKSAV